MKLIKDTLTVNGKWSQKRVQTFTCFWTSVLYAFTPLYAPDFEVKEFVFLGFMAAGGWSLFRTQKQNENIVSNDTDNLG